ncbi:DUF3592 domain-containing protein [Verrucomicrobiaceae bacterium 227]
MQKQGIGGLVYLAGIGLALAAMGGLFVAILGRGYLRASETREWSTVPAVVIESRLGERKLGRTVPVEYFHELVYEYRFEEKFYRGERTKRRKNPYLKEKAGVQAEVDRWKVGMKTEALVNPEDPEEAVLEHDTKAAGYSIWFPGLFLVGGLGVFFRALSKMFGRRKE